jgi:hypothetical protein
VAIKDSGERKEFSTGAVRDISRGKGRLDYVPLDVVADLYDSDNKSSAVCPDGTPINQASPFLREVECFIKSGEKSFLEKAALEVVSLFFVNLESAVLEASIHFEEGAEKYEVDNWKLGIPVSSYVNSGTRHFLKHLRGDKDERHDRAAFWNIFCALWTIKYSPELNDLPRSSVSSDAEQVGGHSVCVTGFDLGEAPDQTSMIINNSYAVSDYSEYENTNCSKVAPAENIIMTASVVDKTKNKLYLDKIIYLDIDGVLNTDDFLLHSEDDSLEGQLDPELVLNLAQIVNATGAKIVLISSWRSLKNITPETLTVILNKVLAKSAFSGSHIPLKVVAFTPILPSGNRGREILNFISEHRLSGKPYVVIDDEKSHYHRKLKYSAYAGNFIEVDPNKGLDSNVVKKAIEILNRKDFKNE